MPVEAHRDYPDGHHPTVFVKDALEALGHSVVWDDQRLQGCEGFAVDDVPVAWLLDNRVPANRARQDPAAKSMLQSGEVVVCHCQLEDANRVGGFWLPLAATPRYAPPEKPVKQSYDVAFVGYLNDFERAGVMARLRQKLSLNTASRVFYEEAAAVYHAARVGLNVPAMYGTGIDYDVNMRVFEIMACGLPLVTNENKALGNLGIFSGVNCLTYTDEEDLIRQVKLLLADPAMGQEMARRGLDLVRRRHTYEQRAKDLLGIIETWKHPEVIPFAEPL